jgi:hypothetical protein
MDNFRPTSSFSMRTGKSWQNGMGRGVKGNWELLLTLKRELAALFS